MRRKFETIPLLLLLIHLEASHARNFRLFVNKRFLECLFVFLLLLFDAMFLAFFKFMEYFQKQKIHAS